MTFIDRLALLDYGASAFNYAPECGCARFEASLCDAPQHEEYLVMPHNVSREFS